MNLRFLADRYVEVIGDHFDVAFKHLRIQTGAPIYSETVGRDQAAVEAAQTVASFISADYLTDIAELAQLSQAFPALFGSGPIRLLDAGHLEDFVNDHEFTRLQPSAYFQMLVTVDQETGSRRAADYITLSVALAKAICTADTEFHGRELVAVEDFERMLTQVLSSSNLPSQLPDLRGLL